MPRPRGHARPGTVGATPASAGSRSRLGSRFTQLNRRASSSVQDEERDSRHGSPPQRRPYIAACRHPASGVSSARDLSGFPARLETAFQTLAAATTLAMVFVIQHTQARAQEATQRKLDEILRASPEADNSLITLEEAPDSELRAATDAHRDVRREAQQEPPP